MSRQPDGAAFDIVLLLHVGCVAVGLVTTLTSAATASRLRQSVARTVALPETMARYFKPGVNWAGRAIYGIPVFGVALLGLSQGAYGFDDGWVMSGLAIFVVLVLVGEGVLWPVERRLQTALVEPLAQGAPPDETITGDVRTMYRASLACVTLIVLGSALMLAQP